MILQLHEHQQSPLARYASRPDGGLRGLHIGSYVQVKYSLLIGPTLEAVAALRLQETAAHGLARGHVEAFSDC